MVRVMVIGPTSAPWDEVADEVELDLVRLRRPGVEVAYRCTGAGPRAIRSLEDAGAAAPHVVRTAVAAAAEGADAVIVDCVDDPGVDAAREAVTIPVVGAGEALRAALTRAPHPIVQFTGDELRTTGPEELVVRARGAATVALGATGYSALTRLFEGIDGVRVVVEPLDAALECCLAAIWGPTEPPSFT